MGEGIKKKPPIAQIKEGRIVAIAAVLSLSTLTFAAYINWTKAKLEASVSQHGFSRAFVISAESDGGQSFGDDAREIIGAAANNISSAQRLLSRHSAETLLSNPSVEAAMVVSRRPMQLTLPNGRNSTVAVFNIDPTFATNFKIGDPSAIQRGSYVPSNELGKQLGLTPNSNAQLGIPQKQIDALPSEMRAAIDWSLAKTSIRLAPTSFDVGQNGLFDNAIFTTGKEEKIQVPGLHLIPNTVLFVKLKDDVDIAAGERELGEFVAHATAANARQHLELAPVSRFFAQVGGENYLRSWTTTVNRGITAIALLLLVMLAIGRSKQTGREIALRKAMGATASMAVWLSVRPMGLAISLGVILAVLATSLLYVIKLPGQIGEWVLLLG